MAAKVKNCKKLDFQQHFHLYVYVCVWLATKDNYDRICGGDSLSGKIIHMYTQQQHYCVHKNWNKKRKRNKAEGRL